MPSPAEFSLGANRLRGGGGASSRHPPLVGTGLPGVEDGFESADKAAVGGESAARGVDKIPYQNGRIPSSALTSIGGGHKLYGKAAQNFIAMREAAKRDGVSLSLTDSYRTYDQQVALAKRKGLYSKVGSPPSRARASTAWGWPSTSIRIPRRRLGSRNTPPSTASTRLPESRGTGSTAADPRGPRSRTHASVVREVLHPHAATHTPSTHASEAHC